MIMLRTETKLAGVSEIVREWHRLCESTQENAERYASNDPLNATFYMDDASQFCNAPVPSDEEELLDRHAEAANYREQWAGRFVGRFRRLPIS